MQCHVKKKSHGICDDLAAVRNEKAALKEEPKTRHLNVELFKDSDEKVKCYRLAQLGHAHGFDINR